MTRKLLPGVAALLAVALPAQGQVSGLGGRIGGASLGAGLGGTGLSSGIGLGSSGGLGGGGVIGAGMGTSGGTGSFLGATSGTTTGRGGTGASQSIGGTTFLGPYYGNPMSLGISTNGNNSSPNSNQYTFGVPLYTIAGTGGAGGAAGSAYLGLAGSSGVGGGTAIASTGSFGASSIGVRRAPQYTTALGFAYRPEPPARLQSQLQEVIARAGRLAPGDNIRVDVDGATVVLRGTVVDEHDRRLAEGLVRLTPGVHDLRNELTVTGAPAPAGP